MVKYYPESNKAKIMSDSRPSLRNKTYSELLEIIQPRSIKTEEDNEFFISVIHDILDLDEETTPDHLQMLDLLAVLVKEFEDQHYQLERAKPYEILNELMTERNFTQKDLVSVFRSYKIVSEITQGKRTISKAQAEKLGTLFKCSPLVFL